MVKCNCTDSAASQQGGGIAVAHQGRLKLVSCLVSRSKAKRGGGIACDSEAKLTISGASHIMDNYASIDGGGIFASGSAGVVASSLWLINNTAAQNGGGLALYDEARLALNNSRMLKNSAESAGAAYAIESTRLLIDQSFIEWNSAVSWGAIAAGASAAVVIKGSQLRFNKANIMAGAIVAAMSAVVNITGSSVLNNTASVYAGAIAVSMSARVNILDSVVAYNEVVPADKSGWVASMQGGVGGAICGEQQGSLNIVRSTIKGYYAAQMGGGILLFPNCSLALVDSVVTGNSADERGGGLSFSAYSKINMIRSNVTGNSAKYDQDIGTQATRMVVVNSTDAEGFVSGVGGQGGVFEVWVKLVGPLNASLEGWPIMAFINSSINSTAPVGGMNSSSEAVDALATAPTRQDGVAYLSLPIRKPPGTYTIHFQTSDAGLAGLSANLTVSIRSCAPGEVTASSGDGCYKCSAGYYSLNPANLICDVCPVAASCPGGTVIIPNEGYWHSSTASSQVHRYGLSR